MTTATLRWADPEDAAEFLSLREHLRTYGWLPDPSRDALVELVSTSDVVTEDADG